MLLVHALSLSHGLPVNPPVHQSTIHAGDHWAEELRCFHSILWLGFIKLHWAAAHDSSLMLINRSRIKWLNNCLLEAMSTWFPIGYSDWMKDWDREKRWRKSGRGVKSGAWWMPNVWLMTWSLTGDSESIIYYLHFIQSKYSCCESKMLFLYSVVLNVFTF